jgi:GST-like protein
LGELYDAAEFLDTASYKHVLRWAKAINEREAVQKGLALILSMGLQ